MKLRMWGTRGSLPRAMSHDTFIHLVDTYAKRAEKAGLNSISEFRNALRDGDLGHPLIYGGNTTCNEIIFKNHRLFVDMGTGFADASSEVMAQGRTEFTVFMTHLHWDHIMGLPFFVPLYMPGAKLTIYHVHPHAPEFIKIQFNGVNFPIKWDELAAKVEFRKLKVYEPVKFDELSVTPMVLDHPGASFGYRFDAQGASLMIGVDGEYKRLTREELGLDLPYYQNLDLLVFDGQYELDELASRYDWGHSSPPIGVNLALREGIRNIIITHHDPRASEAKALAMLAQALSHRQSELEHHHDQWTKLGQPEGPHIQLAYDGLEFDLARLPPRGQMAKTGKKSS
ncbi:MAG: MBL fold metallo-hydrolase [Proteobacteria bacterium]|nr:MBL fold metallo-hydrolase [Pseudomonadota bacterium]